VIATVSTNRTVFVHESELFVVQPSMSYSIIFVTAQDISQRSGAGIATREIVQAFVTNSKIHVTLVAPKPREDLSSELLADIDRTVFMPQKPESPSLFTHAKSAVDGFRGMRETLANERPDAIVARMHHTLLAPAFYANRYDLPYFLLARGNSYKRLRFKQVLTKVFQFNVRAATEVYAASNEIQADADRFRRPEQSETQIMSNAVDPELFTPQPRSEARRKLQLGFRKDDFVVGFVGTMRRMHAVRELVESLTYLSDATRVKLLLIGDGEDRGPSEELASELGVIDSIVFTGFVPHEEVTDYISACDITFGAMKRDSATPIKCFEYMAAGRPVIVNDMPEMAFVDERDIGATISTVTPEVIAAAIETLSGLDEQERAAMGDRARTYILNNHTWQSAIDSIVTDLEHLFRTTKRTDR